MVLYRTCGKLLLINAHYRTQNASDSTMDQITQRLEFKRPAAQRIRVPTDRFGSAYEGQWVERRLQPDELFDRYIARVIGAPGYGAGGVWGQLEDQIKILSLVITDWNLEGDDGPLPKPWLDPGAFLTLYLMDYNMLLWLLDLAAEFATRVTRERRVERLIFDKLDRGTLGHD